MSFRMTDVTWCHLASPVARKSFRNFFGQARRIPRLLSIMRFLENGQLLCGEINWSEGLILASLDGRLVHAIDAVRKTLGVRNAAT